MDGMKILSVSDRVEEKIYDPDLKKRFEGVDMVLGCGDLPYYYIEYLVDCLCVPTFYVRGNHASKEEYSDHGTRTRPWGAVDLHRKTLNHQGILLAGFQGSMRYREGDFQYSQTEMWSMVMGMVPKLLNNKLRYGRYLDILVTHSPPWGINDQVDQAHQGFKAFRWLLERFRPSYHFHGHVHVYSSSQETKTQFQETLVINTYGYKTLTINEQEFN
jgi:Icc-related predicted phosphoesterase